ncbi:hypothetical protein RDWZM_000250, partial [Blomia tropicalis]
WQTLDTTRTPPENGKRLKRKWCASTIVGVKCENIIGTMNVYAIPIKRIQGLQT